MNYYIHNINPTIFSFNIPSIIPILPDYLEIRWYGLAYLLGFIFSFLILKKWSKSESLHIVESEISNFIMLIAILGVFLGGRLGYVLFYDFDSFIQNKWLLFQIWEGGMSSHGGFIGVIATIFWYAKKNSICFWNISDHLAATVSLGIGFGRIANFINGELWGRITDVPWAVIFPQSNTLLPRHPSQLYQSLCEGFLIFFIILIIRKKAWGKVPGNISGLYLILYSIARFSIEIFREPDSTIYFEWLTKGQLYSIFMLLIGIIILLQRKYFLSKL
ncbi:MAG: prolipoprotein diacylglyceryl transferase [Pontiellaceae bacterium]